jgi:hypothetical protein
VREWGASIPAAVRYPDRMESSVIKLRPTRRCSPGARFFAALGSLLILLAPTMVLACAACMNDDPRWARKVPVLLGFIGFPFLVFGGAFWAIRRGAASAARHDSRSLGE